MVKGEQKPVALKLSDSYFILMQSGKKVLRVNKILNGFYFMGRVDQQYTNTRGVSLDVFCRMMTRDAVKKLAHFHKKEGVSKEALHKGLDEMAQKREIDRYTHQRLKHMTRTCNCTAERLYYRLKNALGMERAHLVDGLNFRSENESMKIALDDFDLLRNTLKSQGGQFIDQGGNTHGKN